jgi:hypothetical protein
MVGCCFGNVGGVEIGVVNMPTTALIQMPFEAFAISGAHPSYDHLGAVTGYSRVDFNPRPAGLSELFLLRASFCPTLVLAKAEALSGRGNGGPAGAAAVGTFQAAMAEGVSELVFIGPFFTDSTRGKVPNPENSLAGMVSGISTFLGYGDHGSIRRILVGVTDPQSLRDFQHFLEGLGVDPQTSGAMAVEGGRFVEGDDAIRAYVARKRLHDAEQPQLIPPFLAVSNSPLIIKSRDAGELGLSPARLCGPEDGFVRLMSNRELDAAMARVPEFIRNAGPPLLSPYVFARMMARSVLRNGDHRAMMPIRYTTFMASHRSCDAKFVIGEIALMDVPEKAFCSAEAIAHFLVAQQMPVVMARHVRYFTGSSYIPDDVYGRILKNIGEPRLERLDIALYDSIMQYQLLHECAEILWGTLPRDIQEQWMRLYPLASDRKGDTIFYRNFLRLSMEPDVSEHSSPEEFFASETFADKLALYWQQDVPSIFDDEATRPTPQMIAFFERVMALLRQRHERYGIVTAIER